ncbi:MAG: DUF3160 domain-containing protein [Bacteroidales bacterium]|nr:DUF3160 domain-containing protein [Bacteroidales bacterium]MCF8405953.1 DUF3160 domain-containing protein [Bacteroidales bacterium]
MKKILTICFFAVFSAISFSQSNFNTEEFLLYRQTIKDLTNADLSGKYPPQTNYYSGRTIPSSFETFLYLDSIDLRFSLSADEKEKIANNHFVVSERLSDRSFAQSLVNIYSSDLPLFISTDLILHSLHASYDKMLQELEYSLLEVNLNALISAMRSELENQYTQNSIPEIAQAMKDVDLYLSVGISLLSGEKVLPKYDISGNYDVLLEEILKEEPKQINISLFSEHSRKFDASQFTPRGHYTEEFWLNGEWRDLKNYFRAMMWLGRADFFLTPPPVAPGEEEWSQADIKRMNLGAVMLNKVLDLSGKKDVLQLHEKIIGFFIGPDDNLSPMELASILETQNITPENLLEESVYLKFQDEIMSSDDYGQKIMSNFFVVDADKENAAELPISYKLLGQKFIIDSYIFSQVVYDRIYHNDVEVLRMMPDPLDILFVLGNEDALPILEPQLEKYHYAYKLEELRYLTEAYDDDFWEQSLYNNWLNAIRELNPAENKNSYPYFMNTAAWQVEKLNTQLASWTELRHDNVLYAKQSYTGGTSCSFPHVYIEPYPGFYNSLYKFSLSASRFFSTEMSGIELATRDSLINFYNRYGGHMLKLKELAEKELRQENFSNEDIIYLKRFVNDAMASGPMVTGWFLDLFYDPIKGLEEDYLVVDVHTQPTDEYGNIVGNILHVGTGDINLGIFCAGSPSNNYQPTAFIGPVMSYHEKIETNWKRLNDEEWGEIFGWNPTQAKPARPGWVYQYLIDKNGKAVTNTDEPDIPGIVFTGTNINPIPEPNDIAYLLVYPNPVSESANLRFILNKNCDLRIQVFDVMGREVYQEFYPYLLMGEHDLSLNVSKYTNGMYYVKVSTENASKVTKILLH